MAEGAGFENRCARKGTAGSNPALSDFYLFCRVVCSIKFSSFGRIQFVALAIEGKNANPNAGSQKLKMAKDKEIMSN